MIELQRGMRGKLADHVNCSDVIDAVVSVFGDDVYDYTCFGLDASSKLSDDRYMLFYNQTNSPNNEIQLRQAADGAHFQIRLSALPPTIHKLVFTVSIDGNGTMAMINNHTFTISQGGTQRFALHMTGKDFHAERAIISVEFYRKDGIWRFAAVANGFNGGLPDLLKFYGGEEVSSQSSAPPPAKTVAPSVQTDNHTVSEPSMIGNEIYSHLNFGSNTFSGFFDGVIDEIKDAEINGENIFTIFDSMLDKLNESLNTQKSCRDYIENNCFDKLNYNNLEDWNFNGKHRKVSPSIVVYKMDILRQSINFPESQFALELLKYYLHTMIDFTKYYEKGIQNKSDLDKHLYTIAHDNIERLSNLIDRMINDKSKINAHFMSFWEHTWNTCYTYGENGEFWLDINLVCFFMQIDLIFMDYKDDTKYTAGDVFLNFVPVVGLVNRIIKSEDADKIWTEKYARNVLYFIIGKIMFLYTIVLDFNANMNYELFDTNEDNFFDEL